MPAVLLPEGRQQFFTTPGVPAVGYKLMTWAAGTSTPQTTWADALKVAANPNPIILDGRGEAVIFWDGVYKIQLLDATGSPVSAPVDNVSSIPTASANFIPTVDNTFTLGSPAFSFANLYLGPADAAAYDSVSGNIVYIARTAAEIAAGVTPSAYGYAVGDVRRYGAALDSATDDTAALIRWARVGGALTFPVARTALITAEVPLVSNTTITACGGANIQTATHDINFFHGTSLSNVNITGLKFTQTSAGIAANLAGILLDTCTDCTVENCEFVGMQCCGVRMIGSSYCTARNNYIHNGLANIQSSADIAIESTATLTSSYNIVADNQCFGSAEFGVSCWDPYTGISPIKNIIRGNRIGVHHGYGILGYFPFAGDSFNQFINNDIQDIQAYDGTNPNISSGAGIYVVGAGAGGTQIIGNSIRNCCLNTANASLAPAGIGVSTTSANTTPVLIANNTIDNMTQYHGILAAGLAGGAVISGNSMRMPAANITGDGIRVTNSSTTNSNNVSVTGNVISQLNTTTAQRGITVFANGGNIINTSITGNTINGGHQSYIETVQSGGFLVSGLTIAGNVGNGGDNSCIPLLFNSAAASDVMVTGNYLSGGTATVVSQTGCTNIRYSNNKLKGTGTAILTTSGVCTGSLYDFSNQGTGASAGVVNGATGFVAEQLGTAAPAAGTWAIGDMIRNNSPSAAGVLFWVTTTAGAGTWKTVSNS